MNNVLNLSPSDRVEAKSVGMNQPMTGDPKKDNIQIFDDKPPIFYNVPTYEIEKNPFSFLYVDMTYKCNMECEFCYNPVRSYSDIDIDFFEDVCKKLPHPVNFRFLWGEPTLFPKLGKALDIVTKYGLQCAVVTNGIRFANKNFAKDFYKIWKRNNNTNIAIGFNGGLVNDGWH